ncbi:hypothetical protein [Streptomyces silvisoli]|uniref:Uncharacterized protein n=1 Tax=Streptomyces silvisoli TaxID=3034235 RepID=A0ABT5ZW03_9ACTN|nr:hypothetical protein [Streptomyces silvisoli]MDF3293709.1 hypothetical protein [Streptomyces silvisoli]
MLDCAPLVTAVERLADRFRALPQSRLRGVAEAGLDLARELSCAAQRLELPDREPLLMPDDGVYALGDQIAVAGHDLLAALAGHPGRHDVLDQALRSVAKVEELL